MQNKLFSLLAFAIIYLFFACVTVAWLLLPSPRLIILLLNLSIAISVASALSWCLVCRGSKNISGWRACGVGCLAGVFVVPLFWFFGELLSNGRIPGFWEIMSASIFFPVLFGITAPMGVAAILTAFCFIRRKEVNARRTDGISSITHSAL